MHHRMRVLVILSLCCLALAKVSYRGHQVIQINPQHTRDVQLIQRLGHKINWKINFWNEPVGLENIEFSVPPVTAMMVKQILADNGVKFRVVMKDLQQHIDETEAKRAEARTTKEQDPTNYILSDYQEHSTINTWLDSMAQQYTQATVRSIGRSYDGLDMRALTISSGTGRRAIVIDCGIHAREWITTSTCIYTIKTLLEQYTSNADVRAAVDNYDWHILPVANPDGYQYTHTDDRMWRKTRSLNVEDALCPGTDANRNFDIYWGEAGVSFDPCADTFPGSGPFSELETQAIRDWVTGIQNKILYLNIHSYTQLWLVPWGYHPTFPYPEDYDELMRVAEAAMDQLFAVNGRSFTVGTPPDILYSVAGGALDWAKAVANVKYSFSPELRPASAGEGGFILPPSDITPAGEETFAALLEHCRQMQ